MNNHPMEPAGTETERSRSPQLRALNMVLLLGFLVVTLALIFWGVIRESEFRAREDNPRLVEAELRIQRGRILDRNEQVLAETTGPPERLERHYLWESTGPAVGYYSFRHGTSGIEESYDETLRGDLAGYWTNFASQMLHQPQVGQDVQLTLSASLQRQAEQLMGDHQGAIILLNLPQAEILAMTSHPSFDPNELDALFDQLTSDESAPLLNRAAQGLYQPGLVLQPFIMAAAVDQNLINLFDEVADAALPVQINGTDKRCLVDPGAAPTWADVLRSGCPAPMMALGDRIGTAGLDQLFDSFGLYTPPLLPLAADSGGEDPLADPLHAALGQENLTVSPLQVAQAWAAIGSDGRLPSPQLVLAVQDTNGSWQPNSQAESTAAVVSAAAARRIRSALPLYEDILEYQALVLSGPDGATNAWYLGLAPGQTPLYAVVVVIENVRTPATAASVGRSILGGLSP